MIRWMSSAWMIGALAVAATAQVHTVFPSDHAGTAPALTLPGSSYDSSTPFSDGIARQMIVYDRWDLRIPDGRRIARLGIPRDDAFTATGYRLMLRLRLGQTTRTQQNVSATFDQNYTGTPTVVYGDAQGNAKLFALPDLGPAPAADVVWLPLDLPFTYSAAQSLVADFQVTANQNGNASFWYPLDAAAAWSPSRDVNVGCRSSAGFVPDLQTNATSSWIGGAWNLDLSNATASSPIALLVGLAPYEPGIALAAIGAPGCFLSVSAEWSGAATTTSWGSMSWSFPVPPNRDLFGGRIYSQVVVRDVFANSLGWITTNGDEVRLGIPPQATLIRGQQGDAFALTGWTTQNFGLITVFEHD
jgi:hypothetical protein